MSSAHGSAPDAIAERVRALRNAAGLSLRQLARQASEPLPRRGARPRRKPVTVSAGYLSLIETGRKVPDEPVALALAAALGDDPALYRAWVRVRKRTDLQSALEAAQIIAQHVPGPAGTAPARVAPPRTAVQSPTFAWLRVPVIAAGNDPGEGVRPECEIREWRRLDPAALDTEARARLERPFAIRLSGASLVRVPGRFTPGGHALVLRSFLPLAAGAACAVRHEGRVILSRVMWNGRQLLLLPSDGASDFVVLDAGDETRLRASILGLAVAAHFEPEEPRT